MKKIIFCLGLIGLLFACGEEELDNTIDFSTPYVIQDDPDNPVQHHCYELYSKYGVCVFFNDTIQTSYVGEDRLGNDVYKYETLDLNWDFTSHTGQSVSYSYKYLESESEKEKALRFADIYLERVSPSMRPFCLFLVDTIYQQTNNEVVKMERCSTFRILAMAQLQDYTDEEMDELSVSIISETVLEKIKLNTNLTARFYSVSDREGYYYKRWRDDLGCTSIYLPVENEANAGYLGPNVIFDEGAYEASQSPNPYSILNVTYGGWTEEAFLEARAEIIRQIGAFGFISGDPGYGGQLLSHIYSPRQADDLEFFVTAMLDLGESGFKERYGGSPLVMRKYDILAEYITETLQVELNKQ